MSGEIPADFLRLVSLLSPSLRSSIIFELGLDSIGLQHHKLYNNSNRPLASAHPTMTAIEEAGIDTAKVVLGWLERLEVNSATVKTDNNVTLKTRELKHLVPTTPVRGPRQSPAQFEYVSPTDTTFSYESVFDSPQTYTTKQRNPSGRQFQVENDDASDITSIDGRERSDLSYKEDLGVNVKDEIATEVALTDDGTLSLKSYEPPSDDVSNLEEYLGEGGQTMAYLSPSDPEMPRLVWITSCLQCTLAGLSCSRTPPACSRCKRNGHGDTCLLHRRKVAEEISCTKGINCGIPVLLKVKGDDEEVWERKLKVAQGVRFRLLTPLLSRI